MLEHQIFRQPKHGAPLVLAVFSYRYDAHLVPDLLENIRDAVHGYVAWDDRAAEDALSDEPARRARLIAAARGVGADWLLTADPDERFERGFAEWLPGLLSEGERNLWLFRLHEMFSPTHYRSDGLWGAKSVVRLLPMVAAAAEGTRPLHGQWVARPEDFVLREARVNLYHLRMASPRRRQLRRDLYAVADPDRRSQVIGYDYLTDERGMVLSPLPEGRDFQPPFVEDDGLWAPEPGRLGQPSPDPYAARLHRAGKAARRRGAGSSRFVMADLAAMSPDDPHLPLVAAQFAILAGDADASLSVLPARVPGRLSLARDLIGVMATAPLGLDTAGAAVWARLGRAAPGSPVLAALAADAGRPLADFTAADAAWRGLAPDAVCHEGQAIAPSDLAVVVIGFRNQPGLLAAVQSILDQDAVAEVVVVNSGGGQVLQSLAPVLHRIRLVTTDRPLLVGAARNLGVAVSRAPWIAFLAGDCLALPGWTAGRLARHRGGAWAVSSAVVEEPGAGPVALAANRLRYAIRHPQADPRMLSHYGLSYARWLLAALRGFPPGLRVGEDTSLNRRLLFLCQPVWAPEVRTVHRDLTDMAMFLRDERERGRRRAAHAPYRELAGAADPVRDTAHLFRQRCQIAAELQARDPSLSAVTRKVLVAIQWLAARADQAGTLEGMQQIACADRLAQLAQARDDAALAAQAFAQDPQDPDKAELLARLLWQAGDGPGARQACDAALSLDPFRDQSARLLVEITHSQSGATAAWHLAERLALAAPQSSPLWALAAEAALAAGHAGWAQALGLQMLATGIDLAQAHAVMARLAQAAGDPVGAAFRNMAARRLQGPAEGAASG